MTNVASLNNLSKTDSFPKPLELYINLEQNKNWTDEAIFHQDNVNWVIVTIVFIQ